MGFFKKNKWILFVVFMLDIFVSIPASAGETPANPETLKIMYTSNLLGRIAPAKSCGGVYAGGLARRWRKIRMFYMQPTERLLLDAGNLVNSKDPDAKFKFEIALKAMDRMGYGVMALGREDLALGLDFISGLFKKTSIRTVASNLVIRETGKFPTEPVVYVDIQGIRIAVLGILSPADFQQGSAPSINSLFQVLDPVKVIQDVIPVVKKQAQLVIVLSQLSYNDTHTIGKRINGVDYLIVGVDGIPGACVEGIVLPVQKGSESFNLLELALTPQKTAIRKHAERFILRDRVDSDATLIRDFPLKMPCAGNQTCDVPPTGSNNDKRLTVDQYVDLIYKSR